MGMSCVGVTEKKDLFRELQDLCKYNQWKDSKTSYDVRKKWSVEAVVGYG